MNVSRFSASLGISCRLVYWGYGYADLVGRLYDSVCILAVLSYDDLFVLLALVLHLFCYVVAYLGLLTTYSFIICRSVT